MPRSLAHRGAHYRPVKTLFASDSEAMDARGRRVRPGTETTRRSRHMKKVVTALAAVVALLATSVAVAETAGVTITSTGFNPKTVSVEAGNDVSFKNTDTVPHAV